MIDEHYLSIVAEVDAEFARNRKLHGDRIRCAPGCTACCHHAFQITAIDAAYIAKGVQQLGAEARERLAACAREYITSRGDSGVRPPCPALDRGVCSIYDFRPLICHKFGMPIFNPDKPGRIFACELNFKDGEEIRDPDLIQIQTGIHTRWKTLQSEYARTAGDGSKRLTVAEAILQAME